MSPSIFLSVTSLRLLLDVHRYAPDMSCDMPYSLAFGSSQTSTPPSSWAPRALYCVRGVSVWVYASASVTAFACFNACACVPVPVSGGALMRVSACAPACVCPSVQSYSILTELTSVTLLCKGKKEGGEGSKPDSRRDATGKQLGRFRQKAQGLAFLQQRTAVDTQARVLGTQEWLSSLQDGEPS
jgi:hypothetical protein